MRLRHIWALAALSLVILNAKRDFSQTAADAPKSTVIVAPEKLDFPPQATGTTSESIATNVTNNGSSTLRITDILVSGIDFTEKDTCKTSLAASASCSIQVTFKPAIAGPRLGALRISSSDVTGIRTIPLSGIGQ